MMKLVNRTTFRLFIFLFSFWEVGAFAAPKIGLGIVVGGPTGLTADFLISGEKHLIPSVGWRNGSMDLSVDYIPQIKQLAFVNPEVIDWYYGVGPAIYSNYSNDKQQTVFGIRIPVGLSWAPKKESQIRLSAALVPTMSLVPDSVFGMSANLAGYYYF